MHHLSRPHIAHSGRSTGIVQRIDILFLSLCPLSFVEFVRACGKERLALKAHLDFSAFKLYVHDVGLLGAMAELSPSTLLDGDALFTNFKGSMTEQYVLQELFASGRNPHYWSNDAGNAEVEFVIQGEHAVYPIEAKAGINTQAKSEEVQIGDTKLQHFKGNWYIIEAFGDSELGYQIVGKASKREIEAYRKEIENGIKQSENAEADLGELGRAFENGERFGGRGRSSSDALSQNGQGHVLAHQQGVNGEQLQGDG